jgi:hypothetical protein
MGLRLLFGIVVISCGVLTGCDQGAGSGSLRLPTAASPQPSPGPNPSPSPQPPSGNYAVSGVVSEVVNGQTVPLEGVHVEDSERHVSVKTAADGSYILTEVAISWSGGAYIYVAKPGFRSQSRQFPLLADTRLDITLVRE